MEIICGTYEEMVLGFKLKKVKEDFEFDMSFTDHSHTGNVKTVAISDRGFLATGSTDESIKLFNLRNRKEIGALLHHEGSISSLAFHGKAHMFSASEDGTIVIWKVGSWESLRTLRGHKEAVYDISIHPSGKLAVSVSKDKTMRTWNLITGKCAFVSNIKMASDHIKWMPNGERYVIVTDRTLDIYAVQSGTIEHSIKHTARINIVTFIEDGTMVVAGEGGTVYLYNTEDYSLQYKFETDTVRVKGLHSCECGEEQGAVWLVTGSADGQVKLWRLTTLQGKWTHKLDASTDCKFRITSMAVRVERKAEEGITEDKKKRKKQQKTDDGKKKRKVQIVEDVDEGIEEEEEEEDEEEDFLRKKVKNGDADDESSDDDEEGDDDEDESLDDNDSEDNDDNSEEIDDDSEEPDSDQGEEDSEDEEVLEFGSDIDSDEEESEEEVVPVKKQQKGSPKTASKPIKQQNSLNKQQHQRKPMSKSQQRRKRKNKN